MPIAQPPLVTSRNFRIGEGNVRFIRIRLRRYGQAQPPSVADAAWIQFEWEDENGVTRVPIQADKLHPDADWAQGIVIVVLSRTDVLQNPGNKPYAITMSLGGQEITLVEGVVEVFDRAGYPLPP
jgi:hypothetical protein